LWHVDESASGGGHGGAPPCEDRQDQSTDCREAIQQTQCWLGRHWGNAKISLKSAIIATAAAVATVAQASHGASVKDTIGFDVGGRSTTTWDQGQGKAGGEEEGRRATTRRRTTSHDDDERVEGGRITASLGAINVGQEEGRITATLGAKVGQDGRITTTLGVIKAVQD